MKRFYIWSALIAAAIALLGMGFFIRSQAVLYCYGAAIILGIVSAFIYREKQ